jgi:hypothetical protein
MFCRRKTIKPLRGCRRCTTLRSGSPPGVLGFHAQSINKIFEDEDDDEYEND